jgi:6-phosphogluconolactonase
LSRRGLQDSEDRRPAPAPTVEVYTDHESSSRRVAQIVAQAAERAGSRFTLVISGGTAPRRLFELLAAGFPRPLPWERTHLFWADERCVPPEHPESNYGVARGLFIGKVPIPSPNVHRIRGEEGREAAADAYSQELSGMFGGGPPPFDLALLGLGTDGHTCSLFPGAPTVWSPRLVEPATSPSGIADRVTLTPAALRGCSEVAFLVSGAEKADAVARSLEGPDDPALLPARAIRPASGRVVWVLDEAAAARLSRLRKEARPDPRRDALGRSC